MARSKKSKKSKASVNQNHNNNSPNASVNQNNRPAANGSNGSNPSGNPIGGQARSNAGRNQNGGQARSNAGRNQNGGQARSNAGRNQNGGQARSNAGKNQNGGQARYNSRRNQFGRSPRFNSRKNQSGGSRGNQNQTDRTPRQFKRDFTPITSTPKNSTSSFISPQSSSSTPSYSSIAYTNRDRVQIESRIGHVPFPSVKHPPVGIDLNQKLTYLYTDKGDKVMQQIAIDYNRQINELSKKKYAERYGEMLVEPRHLSDFEACLNAIHEAQCEMKRVRKEMSSFRSNQLDKFQKLFNSMKQNPLQSKISQFSSYIGQFARWILDRCQEGPQLLHETALEYVKHHWQTRIGPNESVNIESYQSGQVVKITLTKSSDLDQLNMNDLKQVLVAMEKLK